MTSENTPMNVTDEEELLKMDEDEQEQADLQARMMGKGRFTLKDFLVAMRQVQKMGPMDQLLKLIPGANNINFDNFTNLSGAGSGNFGYFARFNPADGSHLVGQFVATRLSSGKANSFGINAISADETGQVFVFFILTVAAAEAAIGLAILVVLFRNRRSINVQELDSMKG